MNGQESTVNRPEDFGGSCCHGQATAEETSKRGSSLWWRLGLSIVIAGQSMVFGLGYSNADVKPAFGTATYWGIHGALMFAALLVFVLLAGPLLRETWRAVTSLRVTIESLFFLSILGAFGGSLISTLTGQGVVYYEIVAVLLVVYTFSVMIAAQSREKAQKAARDLKGEFGYAYIVTCCGKRERTPLSELTIGESEVDVLPGELITVDGHIKEGVGYIRETALTGELTPVVKRAGDFIRAGSYAVDASFRITPTALTGQRAIDGVLNTLEAARARPSRLQEQADAMMQWFLPIVVTVALGTFGGWLLLSDVEWWRALFYSMAVLLVACPCALGLATPIGLWGGLMKLSQIGLVARSGRFLDDLARVDTAIFDKTGTLSEDNIALADLITHSGYDRSQIEAIIATAEKGLEHPVARALAGFTPAEGISRREVRILPGSGVEVSLSVNGLPMSVLLGEASLFAPESLAQLEEVATQSPVKALKKKVYIAINGEPVALALLEERLREQAGDTITSLQERGISSLILTGDPNPKWEQLAQAPIESGLTPEAKEARVRALRSEGKQVLFVGDGINDSPAMSEADCSIAMASGADLTRLEASAICVSNRLDSLPLAVDLCRNLRRGIYWNIRFAAIYNVLGMGLAASGHLHPVAAALLMVGASATVSFRALRSVQ